MVATGLFVWFVWFVDKSCGLSVADALEGTR